jgi:hypothetical protein
MDLVLKVRIIAPIVAADMAVTLKKKNGIISSPFSPINSLFILAAILNIETD